MSKEKDELIVAQQLEIQRLKNKQSWYDKAAGEVHMIIYSIPGPLNGNKKGYTKEQMSDFHRIARALDLV